MSSSSSFPLPPRPNSGPHPALSSPRSIPLLSANQPSGTLADLTACIRSSQGDIPPPLVRLSICSPVSLPLSLTSDSQVGASITVLGSDLYVFGGRLVPTRFMVADLYRLNLRSLQWQKIWPPETTLPPDPLSSSRALDLQLAPQGPSSSQASLTIPKPADSTGRGPRPRYFHSAEAWDHKLVIFGGMGYASNIIDQDSQLLRSLDPASDPEVGLCVLDDLLIFDTVLQTWSFPTTTAALNITPPSPRYAHLSCLTNESGYGGPVTEEDYFDFPPSSSTKAQSNPRILKPNKRRQRNLLTLLGGQDISNRYIGEINVLDLDSMQWIEGRPLQRHCGTYRSVACTSHLSVRQGDRLDPREDAGPAEESLRRLSWSEKPSVERPEPVYLYSNFNFNESVFADSAHIPLSETVISYLAF